MNYATFAARRRLIRDHSIAIGAETYRITKTGQVDYYGRFPNAPTTGWYFVSHNVTDWVDQIKAENDLIRTGKAVRT